MTVLNLTLEERERRAYIEGRTAEAELLARALDGDAEVRAELDEVNAQLAKTDDEVGQLTSELDDARADNESLKEQVQDLETERDELRGKVLELEQPLA